MEGKFMLLVVFANLAQFSVAQNENHYGLSEDQVETYKVLEGYLDRSLAAGIAAFDPLFDIIEKKLSLSIYDLEDPITDYSSVVTEAQESARTAVEVTLDAIQIALGESCGGVEDVRAALLVYVDDVYEIGSAVLESAVSQNNSTSGARFHSERKRLDEIIVDLAEGVFSPFYACLEDDDNIAQVIESGQNAVSGGVTSTINALVNAIEILAAAVSAGTADSSDVVAVEGFRNQFLRGIRSNDEGKFSTIFAVYVFRSLGVPELLPYLRANLLAWIVPYHRFTTEANLTFGLLADLMERIPYGFQYDDLFFVDEVKEQALLNREEGYKTFLDSIIVLNSSTTEEIAVAEESFPTTAGTVIAHFFDGLKKTLLSASSKFTDIETALEDHRDIVLTDLVDARVSSYLALLFGNATDQSSAAQLANGYLSTYVNNFYDATELLADRFAAGESSIDDVAAIEAYRIGAVDGLYNFTFLVSELGVDVRKAQISSS